MEVGYVRESAAQPGVFRIRRADSQEAGTIEAKRLYDSVCSACFRWIHEEPFVLVNGEPKHFSHVKGEQET